MNRLAGSTLVVFVADHVGGCETVMLEYLSWPRPGRSFLVACPPGELHDRLQAARIPCVVLSGLVRLHRRQPGAGRAVKVLTAVRMGVKATYQLTRTIIRVRPHGVFVVNSNAGARALGTVVLSRWLLRPWLGRIKWVLSNHNAARVVPGDWIWDTMCGAVYPRIVAVSEAAKRLYPRGFHRKVSLIYNGIDTDRYRFDREKRSSFRDTFKLRPETVALAIIGRISWAKGPHLLIEATSRFLRKYPNADVTLFIIGTGLAEDSKYQEELEDQIRRLGLEARVKMLGPRRDIENLLPGLDVVVNASMPGIGESLGMTLIEAMACSRIVIGPRVGGVPEVIDEGRNGFLFTPGKSEELAETMESIWCDRDRLDWMRNNARLKAESVFSLQRMVREYDGFLVA